MINDSLFQSSSEQSPLNLESTVEDLNPVISDSAPISGSLDLPIPSPPAQGVYSVMQSHSAPFHYWQPPATSWSYQSSHPSARSEIFHTIPRQRGSGGRQRRNWQGGLRRGHFRGRNDFYVGRVSLPPAYFESIAALSIDVHQPQSYLMSIKSPLDFFIPKVVQPPPPPRAFSFGEPSETWTTWRGLSSEGATELFTWTKIYHTACKGLSENHQYIVDSSSIAVEMVKLYEQFPPVGLNWFLSAPNVYQRIERFLLMSRDTPCLQIEELALPVPGQEYIVSPQVLSSSDSLSDGFGSETVFSTSESWLTFDESRKAFSGVVPFTSPNKVVIKAKVVEYLDERVRLEHMTQVKVNLRASSGLLAGKNVTTTSTEPVIGYGDVEKSQKPRKQVSFADEHDTESLHSSPDHLRSFFNELAALTGNPIHEKGPYELTIEGQPLQEANLENSKPVDNFYALSEAKTAVETFGKSSEGDTSERTDLSINERLCRRRTSGTSFSGALSPHPQHLCSGNDEAVVAKFASSRVSNFDLAAICSSGHHLKHDCALKLSWPGYYEASMDEKASFFQDDDTSLNFEVATGLSEPQMSASDTVTAKDRPTALDFWNRSQSLSECYNTECPTHACGSIIGSYAESRKEDTDFPEYNPFTSHSPVGDTPWEENPSILKDIWIDLYQWNWKGWEQEMGITRDPCRRKSKPSLPCDDIDAVPRTICDEAKPGSIFAESEDHKTKYSGLVENERVVPRGRGLNLEGNLLSPTLSHAGTNKGSGMSLEESWSMEEEINVLGKATTSVDKPSTLYDTVRSQFYNDHRTRQMSSPKHSKSSSPRTALSSLFASNADLPEITDDSEDQVEEDCSQCSSTLGDEDVAASCIHIYERLVSPSSPGSTDEDEPNFAPIAAAVKETLAVEVVGQDGREKVEIRKGILHHSLMDLRKNERQRDFGSSDYDDIFWNLSVDEKTDSGAE
jgi:hypothetical protein